MDLILYLIILLEGFVTISLEILTIRQLIPVVGNSVIVTSLIIGIFLLFLAYGYRKGGTYRENYTSILQNNFMLAAFGLGIGLSYSFIELFFDKMRIITPYSTLIPLTAYLLLIVAPVVYFLGQTVPITLNLWKKSRSIGEIGGQILHISTIGSFLGSTITALLLLNYAGVAWSIVIDFSILVLLIFLLADIKTQKLHCGLMILLVIIIYFINVAVEKSFFVKTNNYGNYQVIDAVSQDNNKEKYLRINNSASSYLDAQHRGYPYIEAIKKILFDDLNLRNKTILVLGAGGFTLSAEKTNGNQFIYVDVDNQIADIVKEQYISHINGEFIHDDARHFLNSTTQKYPVIISDVYTNHQSIPAHLLTKEYFSIVKKSLTEGGIGIFNILARPTLDDPYSRNIDATLRSVFHNCMTVPLRYNEDRMANIIYICKNVLNGNNAEIYSDNLNRSTLDYFPLQQ